MQSTTHNCCELRLANAGQTVTIVGWLENVREVGANFAFCVLRDYYGTTQVVIENEEMMKLIKRTVDDPVFKIEIKTVIIASVHNSKIKRLNG